MQYKHPVGGLESSFMFAIPRAILFIFNEQMLPEEIAGIGNYIFYNPSIRHQ